MYCKQCSKPVMACCGIEKDYCNECTAKRMKLDTSKVKVVKNG